MSCCPRPRPAEQALCEPLCSKPRTPHEPALLMAGGKPLRFYHCNGEGRFRVVLRDGGAGQM